MSTKKSNQRKKSNKQNYHIAIQHENSLIALKELMDKDITVLKIIIEDTHPVITVMDTPHLKKLTGIVTTSTIGNGAGREHIKATYVSHCLVRWTSKHAIH